jgi:hypothetical protein
MAFHQMDHRMRWTIVCAECAQVLRPRTDQAGRSVRCPCCGTAVVVTHPPASAVGASASPADPLEHRPASGREATPSRRSRPFWRRRWVQAVGFGVALSALLFGIVAPIWGERLGWFPRGRGRAGGRSPRSLSPPPNALENPLAALNSRRVLPPRMPLLQLPSDAVTPLIAPRNPLPPELPLAGKIDPCQALTGDPVRGLLFTCAIDESRGLLRWYDTDRLRLRGSCRLQGPAYQMVLDSATGQLWTVTSVARVFTINPLGDFENPIANIHLYDLGTFLERIPPPTEVLEPVHIIRETVPISDLILSPGGEYLFYLAQTGSGAVVKRIDTRLRKCDREVRLGGGGPTALTQSPGGKLFALCGGQVHALDPKTMQRQTVRLGGAPIGLCAGERDRLFLSERKQGMVVHAIDWSGAQPTLLASWHTDLEGRLYLRNSPDGRRIYLGNSAVLTGMVRGVDVSTTRLDQPALFGQASSNRERHVRGILMVSPDGHYLVTGTGLVFRTRS